MPLVIWELIFCISKYQYDDCIKDCDTVGTALAKLAKSSKDYDVAIETCQKALTEHRNQDTLKRLNDAARAKKELEQQEYYDPKIADEEREKGKLRELYC